MNIVIQGKNTINRSKLRRVFNNFLNIFNKNDFKFLFHRKFRELPGGGWMEKS